MLEIAYPFGDTERKLKAMPKTSTSSDKSLFITLLNDGIDYNMKSIQELIDVEVKNLKLKKERNESFISEYTEVMALTTNQEKVQTHNKAMKEQYANERRPRKTDGDLMLRSPIVTSAINDVVDYGRQLAEPEAVKRVLDFTDDNVSVDDDASDDTNVIDNPYVMAQLITNAIKTDLLGKDEAMPLSTSLLKDVSIKRDAIQSSIDGQITELERKIEELRESRGSKLNIYDDAVKRLTSGIQIHGNKK